jgi:hypothetical protein
MQQWMFFPLTGTKGWPKGRATSHCQASVPQSGLGNKPVGTYSLSLLNSRRNNRRLMKPDQTKANTYIQCYLKPSLEFLNLTFQTWRKGNHELGFQFPNHKSLNILREEQSCFKCPLKSRKIHKSRESLGKNLGKLFQAQKFGMIEAINTIWELYYSRQKPVSSQDYKLETIETPASFNPCRTN